VRDRGLVLVVSDDTSGAAGELLTILDENRYAVASSAGDVALMREALAHAPDVLVVDSELSDAEPFGLVSDLHDAGFARDLPVIFMAPAVDVEGRVRSIEAGDDVISTPLDTREVLARIARQVSVSKVRRAQREAEAKFRSVMESAVDAIIYADHKGRIRSWNSAATALFGHTETDAVGRRLEIIIPERFRDLHRAGLERVSTGGPTHAIGSTFEVAALRRDGSEFPVELSLATWFLGENRYFTGIIRDITDRKQAEQKFRSVTESAIDAIISADHTGRIVSWNSAATRILGHSQEEVLGQRLELVIPERYRDLHRTGIARYTESGEAHIIGKTVELSALTKAGLEIPIELSLSTWTVHKVRYYTGIIRDISERKAAEKAVRRSEQVLRDKSEELRIKNGALEATLAQISQMQDQLILQEKMASLGRLSAGMAHELNNPASAAQRGASQALGVLAQLQEAQLRLGRLGIDGPRLDRLSDLDRLAEQRARDPLVIDVVSRSDREAGVEDWLDDHGVPSAWELAPTLVSLDYTRPGLEELAASFGDAEFPVAVEWLGLKFLIFSLLSEVTIGTTRIAELVNALKSYTYLDQAPVQDTDVRRGLDDTLIILHSKLVPGVTVVREYAADLPMIQAYASELNQVWTNLIDNAIDAMDHQGTLTIRARRARDMVEVEVENDGPGIPPEEVSKVFDPFFTTKPPGEGTGLGLPISRNIVVNRHRGEITVESAAGQTRFVVRLPLDGVLTDESQG
jgi:PAS domain S-box-containing protein